MFSNAKQFLRRPNDTMAITPPLSLTALLLFSGGLIIYSTFEFGPSDRYAIFIGFAVALLSVGGFAAAIRLFGRSDIDAAILTFNELYQYSDETAFLTDQNFVVLMGNRALGSVRSTGKTADASRILTERKIDGPAIVYRIQHALISASKVTELLATDDDLVIRVEVIKCGNGHLIWTLDKFDHGDEATTINPSVLSVPLLRMEATGKILSCNAAACTLFQETATSLIKQTLPNPPHNNEIVKFSNQQRSRLRVHRTELEDGTIELLYCPVENEELVGITPEHSFETLPVAIAQLSADGNVLYANDAARELLAIDDMNGRPLSELMEGLGRPIDDRVRDMVSGRSHKRSEVARAKVHGHEVFLQVTLKRLLVGGQTHLIAVMSDATELKTLEAQFVQSQKMQAVGQLAGGVAHDFNNLLTAINGYCDFLLLRHESTDTDYGDLIQIRHNANRAASLVKQLLAFSRKQTLQPKVIDLHDTLSDLNHLLNRLLGEKVTLRIDAGNNLPHVRVDERQLEQVIVNLVVNARDAMPDGGEVEIKSRALTLREDLHRDNVVVPFGDYVQIDVTDSGIGIPADQISKIFEPFYTTKKIGEGTGLGLSTAYGITKQTGGFIFADSKVGMGTTFTLMLPAHTKEVIAETQHSDEKAVAQDFTGRGVVLLVEDEVPVRAIAARALNIRGYTVLEAESAEEALEILKDKDLHVDVFVSDVIMPGMDGPTWVRMAQETRPDTRVVFVSGYAEDAFKDGQIKVPNAIFLPKPFSINELTHKVKEQIGATIH